MIKKLLFTLLFGMLVLPLANAQTSSMKIETYKIDNVSTRGLNPNVTEGDEAEDSGDGPVFGSTMIMMGENYPHQSLQYKVQTWYNPNDVEWSKYDVEPNYETWKRVLEVLFMEIGKIPKMAHGITHI